jgi:hypothetical protein
MTGSDRVYMRNRFPRVFFSYESSSTKCSTSTMATGGDQRSRDPEGGPLCVRRRNRKLRNIHPSGAFRPEVTLCNVTYSDRMGFPWVCACATGSYAIFAL